MLETALSTDLTERVLTRLGFSDAPETSAAGLRATYFAWCRSVPFDNIRKLIHLRRNDPGPLPGDHPREFFEAWLEHGTGGTCWSGNGALQALLAALGFAAERAVCTMMAAPDIPPNHGSVTVRIGPDRWMVDASILHSEPLRLDASETTGIEHPAWGVHCRRAEDGRYHVTWQAPQAADGMECRVEWLDATATQFAEHHEATRAWSPFNYALCARLIRGDRIVGAWRGEGVEHAEDGLEKKELSSEERSALLVDDLGISEEMAAAVPEDLEMPSPPGTRSSR